MNSEEIVEIIDELVDLYNKNFEHFKKFSAYNTK